MLTPRPHDPATNSGGRATRDLDDPGSGPYGRWPGWREREGTGSALDSMLHNDSRERRGTARWRWLDRHRRRVHVTKATRSDDRTADVGVNNDTTAGPAKTAGTDEGLHGEGDEDDVDSDRTCDRRGRLRLRGVGGRTAGCGR